MGTRAKVRFRWALAVLALFAVSLAPGPQATASPQASSTVVDCEVVCTNGYYLAAADGGVFAYGDAPFLGSMAGAPLAAPIVGIASVIDLDALVMMGTVPKERGYWLAAADGGVFAFGDARFHGSMAGKALSAPIVAIEASPSGEGYWLLGRDGAIYAFGDAKPPLLPTAQAQAPVVDFSLALMAVELAQASREPLGVGTTRAADYSQGVWSTLSVDVRGAVSLASPASTSAFESDPAMPLSLAAPIVAVVGRAAAYQLVAADGGVFAIGWNARFLGSMTGTALAAPVVDGASVPSTPDQGDGYLLAAADGGIFAFGDAPFFGSMGGRALAAPVVGIATTLGT